MTSCPVCHQPLGDVVPHYPHDEDCTVGCEVPDPDDYREWEWTGDCTCPTPPTHPEHCPDCRGIE